MAGLRCSRSFEGCLQPEIVNDLSLANLPFRLLAIGNRIDLYHAKSINQVDDAGEGRFVFTNVSSFDLPENDESIWKIDEESSNDLGAFTLIFEYGQPARNFAQLAKWAKDWHELEVDNLDLDEEENFIPSLEYLSRLNKLTDRFSKRGATTKPNGNPINQVRTNEVIGGVWQMREFNLVPKQVAEKVGSSSNRETRLKVDKAFASIDTGLWTTTTKNNPMIDNSGVHPDIIRPLARWINQREKPDIGWRCWAPST